MPETATASYHRYSQNLVLSSLGYFTPCSSTSAYDIAQCEKIQAIIKKFLEHFGSVDFCKIFISTSRNDGIWTDIGCSNRSFNPFNGSGIPIFSVWISHSMIKLADSSNSKTDTICEIDDSSRMSCNNGNYIFSQKKNGIPQCQQMSQENLNCWYGANDSCWEDAGFSETALKNLIDPNCMEMSYMETSSMEMPREKKSLLWKGGVGAVALASAAFFAYKQRSSGNVLQKIQKHIQNGTYVIRGKAKPFDVIHVLNNATCFETELDEKKKIERHVITGKAPDGQEATAIVEFQKSQMVVYAGST